MNERDDPTQHLGFLINDVARLMRRDFNRRAQHLGLTQAQWRTLVFLARNEGCNQVALADMLEVQPISLARLLDRLQDAGFVERRPDPEDRRAFLLFLSKKAAPVLEQIWEHGARTREAAMAGLPREEREALARTLFAVRNNLVAGDPTTDSKTGNVPVSGTKRAAHV